MAITLTQSKTWNVQTSGTTNAPAFGAAVSNNGCVVVYIAYDDTATISTVKDNKNNSYTVINTVDQTTDGVKISQAVLGAITNGPTTITVTFTGTIANSAVSLAEWAGVKLVANPTDVSTGQQANATSNPTSGNVTTTANGDLISGLVCDTSSATIPTTGTGFTNGQSTATFISSTAALDWEWQVQAALGAIAANWTSGAINFAANVITLFAATGGSTVTNFGWAPLVDPVRNKNLFSAEQQFIAFDPIIIAVPGTGDILWFQSWSWVMSKITLMGSG